MDMRLRVISGPNEGVAFNLPEGGIENIGRARQRAEICIHDPNVDRVHCEVDVSDGSVVVTDLDSESGTYVNGERIMRQELRHGDVLKVGDSELVFESIGSGKPAESAPAAATKSSASHPALPKQPPPSSGFHPAMATPAAAPSATKSLERLMGTTVGPFAVGAIIGTGHCGIVFRARSVKEDRVVALKVLLPDFPSSEQETQRFVEALKTASGLHHPHLVCVIGAGRTAPYSWIAEEFVEGQSLTQILASADPNQLPPWQQAFRLAVHGARALHFLHHHHILHRNITPANILFRTTDHSIKLGDWVLAKALTGSHVRQAAMRSKIHTEAPYLAPEQTHPSPNLDFRTDIYALGANVYHWLTGRPPCEGKTPAETGTAIRETNPGKPSQWQPQLPKEFEGVVLKMLAKRPEDRYQNAAELLSDLGRIEVDPV